MATMDFLLNEMDWESLHITIHLELLSLSLKKRIIPKCAVIKVLRSKGLINKAISLHKMFYSFKKIFLQNFVICI